MEIVKERRAYVYACFMYIVLIAVYLILNIHESVDDALIDVSSTAVLDFDAGITDGGKKDVHADDKLNDEEISKRPIPNELVDSHLSKGLISIKECNCSNSAVKENDYPSEKEKYCSTRMCGERPLIGPHTTPLKSEYVEKTIDIDDMRFGTGYSKLIDMTVWDLVDANYWRKKKLTMFEKSYVELQAKLATAEVELEKVKKQKACDNKIEKNTKLELKTANNWPLYYGECDTKWENIIPSQDADYERNLTANPPIRTPRIDGIIQPDKIQDKYEIMICRRLELEGSIRIRKYAQYCNDQDVKFTNNPDTERLIREVVGEDGFRFQLAGPEVILLQFKPIGLCRYIAQYKLRIPGVYHVHLIWTHENWAAVNEMSPKHYPHHLDYPLGFENQYLHFGLDSSIVNDTIKALDVTKKHHAEYVKRYKKLPDCKREDAGFWLKGSWILKPDVLSTFNETSDMFLNKGKGEIVRKKPEIRAMVNYKNYMYIPIGCKLQPKNNDLLKQKIQGKNVTFVGDSQTRALMGAFLEQDCEEYFLQVTKLRRPLVASSCFDKEHLLRCKSFQYVNKLCMVGQVLGDMTTGSEADIVVSNFGQHPASHFHWTFDRYATQIAKNAAIIKKFEGKYIWLETFPMPYSKEGWTQLFQDWRTEARLTVFNHIATSTFELMPNVYMVLPSHNPILSFFVESDDGAHYPYPILSGIVDMLYHYMQID